MNAKTTTKRSGRPSQVIWGLFLAGLFVVATGADPTGVLRPGCTAPKTAPGSETGRALLVLSGQITDAETQSGVGGVTLRFDDDINGTTDSQGMFRFDGLAPGPHMLHATKTGYLDLDRAVDLEADVSDFRALLRPLHRVNVEFLEVTVDVIQLEVVDLPYLLLGPLNDFDVRTYIGITETNCPANAEIISAGLDFYSLDPVIKTTFSANSITDVWEMGNINVNALPPISHVPIAQTGPLTGQAPMAVHLDLTDYARTYLTGNPLPPGTAPSFGFALLAEGMSQVEVTSSTHGPPPAHPMTFTLEWAKKLAE